MFSIGPDQTPHGWGGRLCLALVNSILWRRSAEPTEVLTGYDQLVQLSGQAGWLDPTPLLAAAKAHPRLAADALDRTVQLREALYPLFSAVAADTAPGAEHLALLNASMAQSLQQIRIDETLTARWPDPAALDLPRWQAAASAGQLLTAGDLTRLKQCPGERCGWVFVDESRNRSRRWCDTNECGNRERVRAHYRRMRAG